VIHVATVHWQDDRWVEPQLRYLARHLPQHRVYAYLTGLDPGYADRVFYSSFDRVRDHATKLNLLAEEICERAEGPDDTIVFIDGDAFPIADLGPLLADLPATRLAAIRRAELGDLQPHPSFCATTVGTWAELGGDWRKGGTPWVNAAGNETTDVGGILRDRLAEAGIEWRPLERSNRHNPHPLFFGVYGDIVYHHGGGFRSARGGRLLNAQSGVHEARATRRARALDALPRNRATRPLIRRLHPARRINRRLREQTAAQSEEMFARIESNPEFFRALL